MSIVAINLSKIGWMKGDRILLSYPRLSPEQEPAITPARYEWVLNGPRDAMHVTPGTIKVELRCANIQPLPYFFITVEPRQTFVLNNHPAFDPPNPPG